jgi:hypothetical protein
VIRETAGRKRTVTLIGRGLPYRPLSLDGEQRVKITNPAGNPEGFGTVLGPTLGETAINGMWKDKYIGTGAAQQYPITMTQPRTATQGNASTTGGTQIGSVQDAVNLFQSICDEGQLLEVTWGWIIRRGFMKKFPIKVHNIHDAELDATFAWISRALPIAIVEFGPPAGALETPQGLRSLLDSLNRIMDIPQTMVQGAMDEYRQFLAQISDAVLNIEESVSGLANETSPAGEVAKVRSLLGGIVNSAENIKDSFEAAGWAGTFQSPQQLLPFSNGIFPPTDGGERWRGIQDQIIDSIDPEEVLKAQLYVEESIRDARRIRDEAEVRRRLLAAPAGQIQATHIASAGEDLRDVSNIYYGNPYQWRTLLVYNGFSGVELLSGQTILIPRIDPGSVEDL